jgi:hypothetical protein
MEQYKLLNEAQKGFIPGINGCAEHQLLLDQAIDNIRIRGQGEVVHVLTDLSNAFGTVRHSLILFALRHYRYHEDFISLIANMYNDMKLRFTIDGNSIMVNFDIGVFQGDVLSPTLFLVVMNMIIDYIGSKKMIESYGAIIISKHRNTKARKRSCYGIADDLNFLAGSAEKAQFLLDAFDQCLRWTQCFVAAPHKFLVIGYRAGKSKKLLTFDPMVNYNGQSIQSITGTEELYRVLGRRFSMTHSSDDIETFVFNETKSQMDSIDNNPTRAHLKLRMYTLGFSSFSNWNFSVHRLSPTWIRDTLRPFIAEYLKKWSGLPERGASNDFLFAKRIGLGLPDPYCVYQKANISYWMQIKNSSDPLIRDIYEINKERADLRQCWKVHEELEEATNSLKKDTTIG